ncbi:PP2C family protein-serine/threonine phosphatase [Actinoplanes siamensis]|uniref:Cyclic diguanylate phosphodiesterase n=1 Tax=Actinoplanes siamensis TaxID=1223317 RepID=A0A919K898_9ACTN|nr:GAF domain-containing SpoIIE family protein phosphatase [Actinoplanes siamensis]GIF02811.1 cyclic diguanylate phosphodiesterase [Actinoplanes siamensis]
MEPANAMPNYERLRRFQAVTDTAVSRLDVGDLLDELLEHVRELLGADTAAVLLLDPHTRQLEATAAKGLEEEVRRGFRLSVGQGFAGRVAEQREPVVVADVTSADVVNPLLLEKGVRSLLGVPVFAADDVIGVLHIGSLTPREFTTEEILLLQLAADRVSVAVQFRARKLEQGAAMTLQRSLVPPQLPAVEGLQLAARYLPGHGFGVGGDWYDAFPLPGGWLGVVIGDVSGHGLASAIVMGRVRSALRAYALIVDDPGEVLALLDRKVQHFEAGSLTTALYVMIAPDRASVRLSSAGHLRPVSAVPGGPAGLVDMPVDAPLGVGLSHRRRHTTVIDLPAGALLLGYTDGLVERRGQIIDVGIQALVDLVRPDHPEAVCGAVMARISREQPTDDIAVLALRHASDGDRASDGDVGRAIGHSCATGPGAVTVARS